jgi:hypothetical protein
MVELIYTPPLKVICMGMNLQYRLITYKRFSLEAYGGLKFFFIPGRDFANIPPLRRTKEAWYMNIGMLCHFNLGMIGPFVDIGGDNIITVGTEINIRAIYRKPRGRYKLHAKPVD